MQQKEKIEASYGQLTKDMSNETKHKDNYSSRLKQTENHYK